MQIGTGESINSSAPNGAGFSRNSDGEFVEGSPDPGVPDFLCIAAGALIYTDRGRQPIERLRPGDRVRAHDGAYHRLVAIGRATHPQAVLSAIPALTPVELFPGVLGADHALQLSPNHCVMIENPLAELLFEGPVLIPAKALVAAGLARTVPQGAGADYYHLLFHDHVVLEASGVWVESLFLGAPGTAWIAAQRQSGTLVEANPTDTDRDARKAHRALRTHEAQLLTASLSSATTEGPKRSVQRAHPGSGRRAD